MKQHRFARFPLLLALAAALCSAPALAQTKIVMPLTRVGIDGKYTLGLVEDDEAYADDNSLALQTAADAGSTRSQYPWQIPGATGTYKSFFIDRTLVLPADSGRAIIGAGFTKYGESGNTRGSQLVLRAMNEATTFDGTTNRLETSGASATVTVVGRTVLASDQYNSVEITGGTLATTGWYGITSVDTGANTWTLDRTVTSGASTNIQGYYCPAMIRNHGVGTHHEGLYFSSKRLTGDTPIGQVGYHIATNNISSGANTGSHTFLNCSFNHFENAILIGRDLRQFGGAHQETGWTDNHADHLTMLHTWFGSCEQCIHFRNQQSVCHNIVGTRASELAGTVFFFNSGGKLNATGVEVSGAASGYPQRILYVGANHAPENNPFHISGFSFDGGNSTRNPQLVVTSGIWGSDTSKVGMAVFENGILNRASTHDSMYLVDIQGRFHLTLRNIARGNTGIWANSIRLREGTSGRRPHMIVEGCVLDITTNPEEILDSSSSSGVTIDFYGCVKNDGTPITDKRYTKP